MIKGQISGEIVLWQHLNLIICQSLRRRPHRQHNAVVLMHMHDSYYHNMYSASYTSRIPSESLCVRHSA